MEDIKAIIEKITTSLQKNGDLKDQFLKNPVPTIEKITGIDLPDDMVEKVVEGVKAKINLDTASGVIDKLKKLF